MEKCSYFWLDYIVECSTLSFSAKKVFVFLVRLYSGVFHLIIFNLTVNFLSLQSWEADWSPTGCIAVFYVWGLVTLPDALPSFCRLRVQVATVCLQPSRHP